MLESTPLAQISSVMKVKRGIPSEYCFVAVVVTCCWCSVQGIGGVVQHLPTGVFAAHLHNHLKYHAANPGFSPGTRFNLQKDTGHLSDLIQ